MKKLIGWAVVVGLVVFAMVVVHQGLIVISNGQGGLATRAAGTCVACHGGS